MFFYLIIFSGASAAGTVGLSSSPVVSSSMAALPNNSATAQG